MSLKILQTQRQTQRLILTPYLKQVIHIFQLPIMELREFLEEKITENPLLEESSADTNEEDEQKSPEDSTIDDLLQLNDNFDEYLPGREKATSAEEERKRFKESLIIKAPTLQEYLFRQLGFFKASSLEHKIGEFIIGNIDDNGYLQIGIEEITQKLEANTETIENVLSIIQHFDPPGVGARNLKECLLIQLEQKANPDPLTVRIVKEFLPELKNKRHTAIARKLKLPLKEVKNAIEEILKLEPKPGRKFGDEKTNYIIPDLILRRTKDGYEVTINNEQLPQFKISRRYKKLLTCKETPQTTKRYLKDRLINALNLIKAVEQRQQTLKQITETIVKVQREFLEKGVSYFNPLSIRELAKMVGKSESTVSRVIANKYIETPAGVMELRTLFSTAIKKEKEVSSSEKVSSAGSPHSVENKIFQETEQKDDSRLWQRTSKGVKAKIEELISAENSLAPLSDLRISELLAKEGVLLSRRTVTKYRKSLKIPSSYRRR